MTYSIDWPPMFRSRICNPDDPLYIGKQRAYSVTSDANQFHFNTPNSIRQEKLYRSHNAPKDDEGFSFTRQKCRARRVWLLLKADGPAELAVLATLLHIPQSQLARQLQHTVTAGVIEVTRGANPVYSVGPVVPRGEA
jgi:hypothetical protein